MASIVGRVDTTMDYYDKLALMAAMIYPGVCAQYVGTGMDASNYHKYALAQAKVILKEIEEGNGYK